MKALLLLITLFAYFPDHAEAGKLIPYSCDHELNGYGYDPHGFEVHYLDSENAVVIARPSQEYRPRVREEGDRIILENKSFYLELPKEIDPTKGYGAGLYKDERGDEHPLVCFKNVWIGR